MTLGRCTLDPGQATKARGGAASGTTRQRFTHSKAIQRSLVSPAAPSTSSSSTSTNQEDATTLRDSNGKIVRRGPVTVDLLRDFTSLFSSLLKEYAYWVDDAWVSGTIPPDLCGTYYRNGPGLQVDTPGHRRHVFDGDGMVLSLAFKDGRAYFRNRFVRTEGFVKEQAAGRPLFRSSFTRGSGDGSPFFNPFDLNFKNAANTGVLAWAGNLYALWEGGLPHHLNPVNLDTVGPTRLGGAVRGSTLAAHYRVTRDADGSQRWVAFAADSGLGGSSVTFYEFAEDGRLLHETNHKLENTPLAFLHDMVVTEHYYIVLLGAVEFQLPTFLTRYLTSTASIAECLAYQPGKPGRLVLVPRPGRPSGKVLSVRTLECPPCFVFHHANAFEVEEQEQQATRLQNAAAAAITATTPTFPTTTSSALDEPVVVVDTIAWDDVSFTSNQYTIGPEYYKSRNRSHLVRLVCHPGSTAAVRTRLARRTFEFPTVDPRVVGRPHTTLWATCDLQDDVLIWGPGQAVARVQMDPRIGLTPGSGSVAATSTNAGNGAGAKDGLESGTGVLRSAGGTAPGVYLDIWCPGERCFPGEPMFVPRPGSTAEGEGWLIVAVHDAGTQKGEVVILDAQNLSAGPLATLHLPHRLPAGLHGSWHPVFTGPEESSGVPRWQEVGTIRAL